MQERKVRTDQDRGWGAKKEGTLDATGVEQMVQRRTRWDNEGHKE